MEEKKIYKTVCYHNNLDKIETESGIEWYCKDEKKIIATVSMGKRLFSN